MITIIHFENGIKQFNTEEEFVEFVKLIFNENEEYTEDDDTLRQPENAEEAATYVAKYCGNFEMIYYQPEFENDDEMIENNLYSFEVYLQLENAKSDFPNHTIKEYKDDDIEDFTVIESFK